MRATHPTHLRAGHELLVGFLSLFRGERGLLLGLGQFRMHLLNTLDVLLELAHLVLGLVPIKDGKEPRR